MGNNVLVARLLLGITVTHWGGEGKGEYNGSEKVKKIGKSLENLTSRDAE